MNKFICITFLHSTYIICYFFHLNNLIISRSIHVAANGIISLLLMTEKYSSVCVCVCVYHIFIHSYVDEHLGCFHILAILNSAAINIMVHVSFWIRIFSGYIPIDVIVGSCGNCIYSFLRNIHNILYCRCINLHATSSVGGFPFLHTFSSNYRL